MAPTIYQLSSERGWRGGEMQLSILVRHLGAPLTNVVCVPRDSELARRLDGRNVRLVDGFGFLRPLTALELGREIARGPGRALLHAHSSRALETAILCRLWTRTPVVVSRKTSYAVRSPWKYKSADAVVAVSRAARDVMLGAGVPPERITIIPDAVDPSRFEGIEPDRLGLGSDAVLVLCAAAFSAEKDHATLLHAWAEVEKKHVGTHLALAGDGVLLDASKRLCGQLGLRHVHFLGWRQDIGGLIAGSDIAVLSSRAEGLSSFLCEAQWAGLPVVATSAGGVVDAIEDGATGLLSPVGDVASLAGNLSRMIADGHLRRRFGEGAATRARRLFDPNSAADAHAMLYRRLLGL